jgi:2,5-furandicarboxylate decarboxylase 1
MTQINDLRSFIEILRQNNQLAEIERPVSLEYEIGTVIANLEKKNMGAGLFKNVKNSKFQVIGGVLGSMERVALALGCKKSEINEFVGKCLDNPIPPVVVDTAPCHQNILLDDEADLNLLPIPTHAPKDGGPYIPGGVTVGKELHGNRHNLSFIRMQLKGKRKLGVNINEWRHMREFYDEAEKEGKRLPIAVVIGADPVYYIAAGLRYDGDETEIAGALRGKAIEVVKCITSDIYVPATSEIVIEAEILPHYREEEGPLGEYTGHYSATWQNPVLEVKAITYRNGAIFQTIAGASFEHVNLGNVLPREPLLKKFTQYVSSGVINVHLPPYGSGFLALIQVKKKNPGEPKNLALAAMMSYVNIKNVIVVDEDVDIFNPADVMWALSNRVIPEKDIFYVPNSQGHELDPSSDRRGVHTKMGIDATLSEESKGIERVVYPDIDLQEYLDAK